jgi:tetratricopeptide (TPR) repeat protein
MFVDDLSRRVVSTGWLIAGLMLLGAGTAEAQQARAAKPDVLKQAYQQSKTAKTEAQYSDIIKLCEQGLTGNPTQAAYARQLMAWAYNKRGELLADTGQDEEALRDFEQSVEMDKTAWRALHNRGVSYASRGQYAEATADFAEVIRLKPNFPTVWFNRAELRSQTGEFSAAIEDYDQTLKLDATDPAVYIGRGHARYLLGQHELSLTDFNRALQLDKNRAEAYLFRAAAYADTARYAEAADDYRAAIRLAPTSAAAYQATAWMMATCPDARFRDPKLAVKAAEKAIALRGADEYRDQETLAAAQASAGEFAAAIEAQQKALSLVPSEAQDVAQQLEERLQLYQQDSPYVEPRRTAEQAEVKSSVSRRK